MLSRRSFLLTSIAALITSQLISGCSNQQKILKVLLLQGSIPPQLLNDFRKTLTNSTKLDFEPKSQLKKIFNLLEKWQQQNKNQSKQQNYLLNLLKKRRKPTDLATLSDYRLLNAIKKGLIQPLDTTKLKNWDTLPSYWQKLVRRNAQGEIDDQGKVYGAPYRWGNTLIAYRSDKLKEFDWELTDWSDLWRTELQGRISLLDEPREVIGLTLKKLGYSYNTSDLSQIISDLRSELEALHKQVKFYSSDNYLQPLILGDTWLAVGWSTDILPLLKRYSNIKIVVPESGTSLWADLWVQPKYSSVAVNEENLALRDRWIDFCWQPKSANQISLFTNAISPILAGYKPENLPENLQNNYFLESSLRVLAQSDFLKPFRDSRFNNVPIIWLLLREIDCMAGILFLRESLIPETEKKYKLLWEEMRARGT